MVYSRLCFTKNQYQEIQSWTDCIHFDLSAIHIIVFSFLHNYFLSSRSNCISHELFEYLEKSFWNSYQLRNHSNLQTYWIDGIGLTFFVACGNSHLTWEWFRTNCHVIIYKSKSRIKWEDKTHSYLVTTYQPQIILNTTWKEWYAFIHFLFNYTFIESGKWISKTVYKSWIHPIIQTNQLDQIFQIQFNLISIVACSYWGDISLIWRNNEKMKRLF